MKVMWIGGPLDGCVDDIERPTLTWITPDLDEPETKCVVYVLMSDNTYRFRQDLTNKANDHLRDLRLS